MRLEGKTRLSPDSQIFTNYAFKFPPTVFVCSLAWKTHLHLHVLHILGAHLPLHCTPLHAFSYFHRWPLGSKHHFFERNFILFPGKKKQQMWIKFLKRKKKDHAGSDRAVSVCFTVIGSFTAVRLVKSIHIHIHVGVQLYPVICYTTASPPPWTPAFWLFCNIHFTRIDAQVCVYGLFLKIRNFPSKSKFISICSKCSNIDISGFNSTF